MQAVLNRVSSHLLQWGKTWLKRHSAKRFWFRDAASFQYVLTNKHKERVAGSLGVYQEANKPPPVKLGKNMKTNTGGSEKVCVTIGIDGVKDLTWVPKGKMWNQTASNRSSSAIAKKIAKTGGNILGVVEDGDPCFQGKRAVAHKKKVGLKAVRPPRRSPDLQPLDISVFGWVKRQIYHTQFSELKTKKAFKNKLTKIFRSKACKKVCKNVIEGYRKRVQWVVDNRGQIIIP